MDKKDDNVVGDFVARRIHQRKQAGEDVYDKDPILQAADEFTKLYSKYTTRLSAEDLFVAVRLSERALFTVLHSAVGPHHALDIMRRANERAQQEFSLSEKGVPAEAKQLFEDEKPDGE
jgi:hypothetical protein